MTDPIAVKLTFDNISSIPLTITQTTTQNGLQFWLLLIVSSFGAFYFLSLFFNKIGINIISSLAVKIFKRSNGIKHMMVIKHTQSSLFNVSMINQNTLEEVQKALTNFKGHDFDLILYTGGGEIFSAQYISRLFKNYKGKIRTFVPTYSMSGGTYLALSTDEIYMNDYACLGAIDPQLGSLFSFGSAKGWNEVMKLKKNKANDQSIIMNLMGKQYSKSMKENVDNLLLDKIQDKKTRKDMVEFLTSGQMEHAFPLTRDTLNARGLKVGKIDDNMNGRLITLLKVLKDGVTYG